MASFVLKNAYFSYATVDLTNEVESLTLNFEAEAPDDSAMGDSWRSFLSGGMKGGTIEVTFNQNFAASNVDATLWPVMGTSAAFEIRPTTSVVGAANPSFTGVGIITSYSPIGNTVGDKATAPVSIVCKSTVARAVV